ncbi:MAG: hypothetical protein EXS55_03335 [Candidatus Magasanikbacteria bacterium]|nr:hypothetical protein [Candidatus Magasanikbacteria bacterium]
MAESIVFSLVIEPPSPPKRLRTLLLFLAAFLVGLPIGYVRQAVQVSRTAQDLRDCQILWTAVNLSSDRCYYQVRQIAMTGHLIDEAQKAGIPVCEEELQQDASNVQQQGFQIVPGPLPGGPENK